MDQDTLFEGNQNDHGRAVHNYRCASMCDYFRCVHTVGHLLLVLLSLSFAHNIMARIVPRDGMPARSKHTFRVHEVVGASSMKSKPEVLVEFVSILGARLSGLRLLTNQWPFMILRPNRSGTVL